MATVATAALAAACTGSGSQVASAPSTQARLGHDAASSMPANVGSYGFGEPAPPSAANRTIKIRLTDELRFEPAKVRAWVGETITFEIANESKTPHEFVLGDETTQQEHAGKMAEMDGGMPMPDEPNAVSLSPGEVKRLTWAFAEPGEVTYACHVPGHYEAGMVGHVSVSDPS